MIRKIIKIDKEKCNGCGLCAEACHEGAIGMVNGKAQLLRDDYCDGLGDCLPVCPADAISFEEREADPYDKEAVEAQMAKRKSEANMENKNKKPAAASALTNWPVQIKLAPIHAPYFEQAHLLIAADCTAFAYGDFHQQFLKGRVALIGCPKLDQIDYWEKLAEILRENTIQSVCVTRMEVPCCGGLEFAVKKALEASEKDIPLEVITIGIDGQIR